jgi:hypothetical protein
LRWGFNRQPLDAPDVVDDHAAAVKHGGDVGVADEVEVALPVANFAVFEARARAWKHAPEGEGGGKFRRMKVGEVAGGTVCRRVRCRVARCEAGACGP